MQRICIVPFTESEYPVAINLPKDRFATPYLVSPRGIATEGDDISRLKNTLPTGLKFVNSFEGPIMDSDIVIISKAETSSLRDYAYKALCFAADIGKKIICYLVISSEEAKDINTRCNKSGAVCEYPAPSFENVSFDKTGITFHDFEIPIIYIEEVFPNCDGYDSFLKISTSLRARGYNVLAFSENPYNTLFSFEYVKLDTAKAMKDQLYYLNELAYQLVRRHYPDIIVILLPQPFSKYDNTLNFDGGISTYAISQAIPGDASVLCSLYGISSNTIWNNICSDIQIKQGFPVIGIHVSNVLIDRNERQPKAVVHNWVENSMLQADYLNSHSQIPFYNFVRNEDLTSIVDKIENEYVNLPYGVI